MNTNMLDQIVRDIKMKGWSFQKNILTENDRAQISVFFDVNRSQFQEAKIGKSKSKHRNPEIRGDHTFWVDPLNPPTEFLPIVSLLDEIKTELNQQILLGAKEYECHLAFYPPGTFYKKHLDRFEKDSTRVLSFIFYLHNTWSEGDGGELVIYENEEIKISPLPGSMVVFLSEGIPHEVLTCFKERRSFTGWMHSKIIY